MSPLPVSAVCAKCHLYCQSFPPQSGNKSLTVHSDGPEEPWEQPGRTKGESAWSVVDARSRSATITLTLRYVLTMYRQGDVVPAVNTLTGRRQDSGVRTAPLAPELEGYLDKLKHKTTALFGSSWNRRYFIVYPNDRVLAYFNNKEDMKGSEKPSGMSRPHDATLLKITYSCIESRRRTFPRFDRPEANTRRAQVRRHFVSGRQAHA